MLVAMGKNRVMTGDAHVIMQNRGRGLFAALGMFVFGIEMTDGALGLGGMDLFLLAKSRMTLVCNTACLPKGQTDRQQQGKNGNTEK